MEQLGPVGATILEAVTHLVETLCYVTGFVYITHEMFKYMTHRLDVLGAEKATIFQKARPGFEFVERDAKPVEPEPVILPLVLAEKDTIGPIIGAINKKVQDIRSLVATDATPSVTPIGLER